MEVSSVIGEAYKSAFGSASGVLVHERGVWHEAPGREVFVRGDASVDTAVATAVRALESCGGVLEDGRDDEDDHTGRGTESDAQEISLRTYVGELLAAAAAERRRGERLDRSAGRRAAMVTKLAAMEPQVAAATVSSCKRSIETKSPSALEQCLIERLRISEDSRPPPL
jgi:hypothetical protein